MREVADWAGRDVLDIGCGTGFHLPRFAATARSRRRRGAAPAAGAGSRGAVRRRLRGRDRAPRAPPRPCRCRRRLGGRRARPVGLLLRPRLRAGARRARPRRTPGWRRPFVVDNDAHPVDVRPLVPPRLPDRSTRRRSSGSGPRHGWSRTPLDVEWRFETRAELEAVVRIELDPATADAALAEHEGTTVDYAVNLSGGGSAEPPPRRRSGGAAEPQLGGEDHVRLRRCAASRAGPRAAARSAPRPPRAAGAPRSARAG